MPQVGPDLVGAGYPTGNALNALLGGSGNVVAPNQPIYSNAYFGLGNLSDAAGGASATSGSVQTVAVPVIPGAVITKISWLVGANGTGAACATAVTNAWSALYTGTGSAPGTTGAAPVLISQTASLSGASVTLSQLYTFTFATPPTITSINAPFGYVYASLSTTIGAASPNNTQPSLVSLGAAAATQFPWFSTSPFSLYMTSNGATGSAAPATIGTAVRAANPPVCLLY